MAVDLDLVTESYSGLDTHWGLDEYLFSAQGNDLDHSRKGDTFDGSGFGTDTKNTLVGMREGTLKIKGFAAMGKGKISDILEQRFGRSTPVLAWYATEGLNALAPITMQPSRISDSSVKSKPDSVVEMDVELAAAGAMNQGYILLSPKTLLTGASGTGPEDDNTENGGATSFGGAAQLHVWSLAGGTNPSLTVKLEHSADGETFTDLATFPAVSSVGAWRIKIPSTTTVNAIVRASWTATGSPTEVQVLCGFARGVDRGA